MYTNDIGLVVVTDSNGELEGFNVAVGGCVGRFGFPIIIPSYTGVLVAFFVNHFSRICFLCSKSYIIIETGIRLFLLLMCWVSRCNDWAKTSPMQA